MKLQTNKLDSLLFASIPNLAHFVKAQYYKNIFKSETFVIS